MKRLATAPSGLCSVVKLMPSYSREYNRPPYKILYGIYPTKPRFQRVIETRRAIPPSVGFILRLRLNRRRSWHATTWLGRLRLVQVIQAGDHSSYSILGSWRICSSPSLLLLRCLVFICSLNFSSASCASEGRIDTCQKYNGLIDERTKWYKNHAREAATPVYFVASTQSDAAMTISRSSRSTVVSVLVASLLSSAYALPAAGNDISQDATLMLCVYPISGAYGLLPRLLYYATLVLAIFGRSQEWLVIGALASALTYAGTAAIHTMTLCTSRQTVFDLDISGAWAILSTGALAYITLINWSTTLRNSRARIVMVCWGVLVGVALIFSRSELFDTQLSPGEPACHSSGGLLLSKPYQLVDSSFNCTYKCFSTTKPLREQSETVAIRREILSGEYSHLSLGLIGPVMFAAYAAITFDAREHSPSQLYTRLVMSYLNPKHHAEITKSIYKAASESWYGGYFALFSYVHRERWSIRKCILSFLAVPWFALGLALDLLCIPLLMTNIILNELNLIGAHLPTNESPFAVGQWGPIVSSLLIVIAAIINRALEIRESRKTARDIPREETDVRFSVTQDLGELEGQTSGVVLRTVGRQETLKDMEQIVASSKT